MGFLPTHSQITYTNTHANFVGGIATTALASSFSVSDSIENREPVTYTLNVPSGAEQVGATISLSENAAADLDLYLFDCTRSQCVLRDFATANGSHEQVFVEVPAAGTWKVVVDPFRVSRMGTTYQYKDYFLQPALGRITVANASRELLHGATNTQRLTLNLIENSETKRQLEAMIFVTNEPVSNKSQPVTNRADVYYADKGILGTVSIPLKRSPSVAAKKQSSHGARP
jgi:hypothetical protein